MADSFVPDDAKQDSFEPDQPIDLRKEGPVSLGSTILQGAKDLAIGAGKGAASTIFHLSSIPERALGMEQRINRPEVQAGIAPEGIMQNTGFGLEHAAEYAVPASEVGKAAQLIKGAGKLAGAARMGVTAMEGAAAGAGVAGAQSGGDPTAMGSAGALGALGGAASTLPTVEKTGKLFDDIRSQVGSIPINITKPGNAALAVKDAEELGGASLPVINKFLKRVSDPNKPPLTYTEAREFYSNATQLSAKEAMSAKPRTASLLGDFREALDDALTQAADQAGRGADYQKAMRDYHSVMQRRAMLKKAKEIAIKAGVGLGGIGAGYEVYKAGQGQ